MTGTVVAGPSNRKKLRNPSNSRWTKFRPCSAESVIGSRRTGRYAAGNPGETGLNRSSDHTHAQEAHTNQVPGRLAATVLIFQRPSSSISVARRGKSGSPEIAIEVLRASVIRG